MARSEAALADMYAITATLTDITAEMIVAKIVALVLDMALS